jgi:fatty acid desaturase
VTTPVSSEDGASRRSSADAGVVRSAAGVFVTATPGAGDIAARDLGAPELVRELAVVDWRRSGLAIARQWAVIVAAIGGAVAVHTWWAYVLAIVLVATRQHALLVLMHDGAHRLLARRQLVNDVVSDSLLAFPLFISTSLYRRHHFLHHRFLNSDADPDLLDARESHARLRWLLIFLADASGMGLIKQLRSGSNFSMFSLVNGGPELRRAVARWQLVLFALTWTAIGAAITVIHGWTDFLLLWIVPMLTVLTMILHIRAVAEHAGCAPVPTVTGTRTVIPGVLERLLFAPVNINYHLAHHLFPAVPATNLKRLHAQLSEKPLFREHAHITLGYLLGRSSVLAEVSRGADADAS